MAITLVVNPGSTSKKYALYNDGAELFSIQFEETGDGFGICREKNKEQQKCEHIEAHTYKKALDYCIDEAIETGVISHANDIQLVGVRIVAPGTFFSKHQIINDAFIKELENVASVVPQHVPVMLEEIYSLKSIVAHAQLYAISDSAFHTSMPTYRRRIGIDRNDADTYDIARFGYHGLSMASIARRNEAFFGVAPDRVVAVHVGGGVSVTALHYQESVDTSMGYSPSSGVLMGSRVGSCDADALLALLVKKGVRDLSNVSKYLNKEGGFKGLTGYADLRLVLNKYSEGNEEATEALKMFRYQIHRQIGGHIAVLGGIDALVFTGTAVVRNPSLRAFVLSGIESFGLTLDQEKNDVLIGAEGMIHSDRSDVSIAVMKNDEMGEIARAVCACKKSS